MMEVEDPFNFITTECLIPATQHDLLSTTPFYRQDEYSPADGYGFDDAWPVTSDDDDDGGDGVPLLGDNIEEVTFCSVPSTPDNQDDVVPSHSDELEVNTISKLNDVVSANSDESEGLYVERKESYVTPPLSVKEPRFSDLNDVVREHSDELGFCAEGNTISILSDVVSGNSDELEGLGVEREESFVTPSPSAKEPRSFDLNDVVCGISDELGFSVERKRSRYCEGEISAADNTATDLNDVVCGDSDELGFSVGRKRAREESSVTLPTTAKKLRFCDDGENTMSVANDVVCEDTDGLGLRCCEDTEEIPNDVVCEKTGDLGLRFSDGDQIAVENTEVMINDVVSEDFDELGSGNQERSAKENSLMPPSSPPTDNTKGVTNDVVSGSSVDLGFQGERNTTNEESVSPTTTKEFVDNTKIVQNDVVSEKFVDLGDRNVTNEEFTMASPSTTKELRYPELDGAEMAVDRENTAEIGGDTEAITVVDDGKGKEHNTEEIIEDDVSLDNTEKINTSDSEGGDDNGDDDTEEIAEEEELNNSTLDRDLKPETSGIHVNCLMEVLKMLAERSGKKTEGGEVDFLETAKRHGYTFPKPRWMSS